MLKNLNLMYKKIFYYINKFNFFEKNKSYFKKLKKYLITGFCWSVVILVKNGATVEEIIIKGLDLITVTVPPALPTCISIGASFSL